MCVCVLYALCRPQDCVHVAPRCPVAHQRTAAARLGPASRISTYVVCFAVLCYGWMCGVWCAPP